MRTHAAFSSQPSFHSAVAALLRRRDRAELGFDLPFETIMGGIFEVGFPYLIEQMWDAFLTEREGTLGPRFGCATLGEALGSRLLFAPSLQSQRQGTTVDLEWNRIAESP